ncbi:MAG: MarR family transcriptional regulator [Deltaproteobacteria bacterium]|nr:MarR family transcriptional regulator [Deltaproteobacteria bacterium]
MLTIIMVFSLDSSLGFLMNRAANLMKGAIEERLRKYGLTAPQWAVLARLTEEDGLNHSEICARLFFDKPTITGIVGRLEKKGLVKRLKGAKDRREVKVHLTGKGKNLMDELPSFAEEVNRAASKGLDARESAALKDALRKVISNLGS